MKIINIKSMLINFLKLSAPQKLFLVFWITKPFYLLPSGSFQIGDLFLILSFISMLLQSNFKFKIFKNDLNFFIFMVFVLIINSIYGFIYMDMGFIKSIFYYVFNFIAILDFNYILDKEFINMFITFTKFNILIQFILILFLYNSSTSFLFNRYTGTYNDPNQMAFAMIIFYATLLILGHQLKTKISFIWTVFVATLIIISASTGMLMAMFLLFEVQLYFLYKNHKKNNAIFLRLLFNFQVILLIIILAMLISGNIQTNNQSINRVIEKFSMVNNSSDTGKNILEDRLIDKAYRSPFYMLIGAGEGKLDRFPTFDGYLTTEIHSTWIALLFYYGVIPFLFLCNWIRLNLKNIDKYTLLIYLSILLESLTLANQRQPAFWILLILSSIPKRLNNNVKKRG